MCRQFVVKGRVQGVFFRASTRDVAESLGIKGHAINLANGDVEVLACGSELATERLLEWLKVGPQLASVDDVEEKKVHCLHPGRFETG